MLLLLGYAAGGVIDTPRCAKEYVQLATKIVNG